MSIDDILTNPQRELANDYMNICGYSERDAYAAAFNTLNEDNGQTSLCL